MVAQDAPINKPPNLPWVESPFFESDLQQLGLDPQTEAQVRHYADQGYLIFDPQIDEATLDAARAQTEPLYPQRFPHNRLQDVWTEIDEVRRIATAPKVMELLRLFYGREPIPFQTLNFNVGTQQRTHSDAIHFHSIPQRFMCGVWVALEDVYDGNGPLHYYPGSHKLPFYDLIDMGLKGTEAKTTEEVYGKTYKQYEERLEAIIRAQNLTKAVLNMKKGQAIIWAANLLHGGDPIRDPGSTRHSQVTHYFFENCVYYTPLRSDATIDKLYIRQITNIATGERVQNVYFDQPLEQKGEGYPLRVNVPTAVLKVGRFIPPFVRKMLRN